MNSIRVALPSMFLIDAVGVCCGPNRGPTVNAFEFVCFEFTGSPGILHNYGSTFNCESLSMLIGTMRQASRSIHPILIEVSFSDTTCCGTSFVCLLGQRVLSAFVLVSYGCLFFAIALLGRW